MDYPHFSVNFVNFGIHKLSTLIKMGLHSCVKKKGGWEWERERTRAGARRSSTGEADWMPSIIGATLGPLPSALASPSAPALVPWLNQIAKSQD